MESLVLRRQQQGFDVHKVYRDEQLPSNDWSSEFIQNKISELSREPNRSTYVFLVGDWNESSKLSYVPAATGKQGRMQEVLTDHAYGLPNESGVPTIAVGRFPARSLEVSLLVAGWIGHLFSLVPGRLTNETGTYLSIAILSALIYSFVIRLEPSRIQPTQPTGRRYY